MSDNDFKAGLKKLARSRSDRAIGGVCGGIAKVSDIPSWIIRAAFVVGAFAGGAAAFIYLVLWILMPEEQD
ncbi:PspC domain-containing protein [Burkholderiaceae bacterium DAT-1]|nr:PspC domain-containing protein [Burkholderiaceae bacterium DAT-1]